MTPDTELSILSEEEYYPQPLNEPPAKLFALSDGLTVQRLADRRPSVIESYLAHARSHGAAVALAETDWVTEEILGPNMSDKETLLTFGRMTANDYIEQPGAGDWNEISGRFNWSSSFGWQRDGLRGHIYADETNSTIVISLKGTSPALFDGAETTTNDKINDNLYFSCCCAQQGPYLARQVCDCATDIFKANLTCIVEAMLDEHRYYRAAIDLYTNATLLYPQADVWLTGHSLGGAMSALLGLTFGLPTVALEAIPDALPAARLGLPTPPGYDPQLPQKRKNTGVYHVGHTADPIYMGSCNGVGATCTWWGYDFESACHTGNMCVYDTVEDKGWRVSIGTHRIKNVIKDVLEAYDAVPPCVPEEECYDCQLWKFFKSNGSEITTTTTTKTTSTTASLTRTSTCKTPGWWGCLDESTSTTPTTSATTTSTTSITTSSTTTCKTPGWFGCKDRTTTTRSTTILPSPTSSLIPTSTTTCHDPGWFGCRDPTTNEVPTSTMGSESSVDKIPAFVPHAITAAPVI